MANTGLQQVLQTGAGVVIRANNTSILGFATGLTFTRTLSIKAVHGVDSFQPSELIPSSYQINGTLTGIRIRDSGGLDGTGLMNASTVNSIFNQQYVVLEIVDRLTGVTIYKFIDTLFDSDSWSIQNKQVISFSANFKARFLQSEVSDNNQ